MNGLIYAIGNQRCSSQEVVANHIGCSPTTVSNHIAKGLPLEDLYIKFIHRKLYQGINILEMCKILKCAKSTLVVKVNKYTGGYISYRRLCTEIQKIYQRNILSKR